MGSDSAQHALAADAHFILFEALDEPDLRAQALGAAFLADLYDRRVEHLDRMSDVGEPFVAVVDPSRVIHPVESLEGVWKSADAGLYYFRRVRRYAAWAVKFAGLAAEKSRPREQDPLPAIVSSDPACP